MAERPIGDLQAVADVQAGGRRRQAGLVEVLWRRRTTLFAVTGLCIAAALLYLILATPKYSSISRLYIQRNSPRVLVNDIEQGNSLVANESYLYTQAELIRSVPTLLSALEQPGISQLKLFDGVDNKLDYLKEKLDVTVGKKDEIISVSIPAVDPNESAKMVNAIVDSFVRFSSKQNRSTTSEVLKILEGEKTRREQDLERQNQVILDLKLKNGPAFFETQNGVVAVLDLAVASAALTDARIQNKVAQSFYVISNSKTFTAITMAEAEARETEVQKVVDGLRKQVNDIIAVRSQCQLLQVDVDRTQKVLDQLDTRIKELDVSGDTPLNITILETGRPEDKPSSPKRLLTMAIALMAGLTLGSGAAVGLEWMDNRVRTPEEVSELLNLPVLAVVPQTAESAKKGNKKARAISGIGSEAAEAYRGLRTALHFGGGERRARTILITSAASGDGKSTTAANLAVALAKVGRRVLLIDADLRKPVQHITFDVKPAAGETLIGLAEVLASGLDLMPKAVHATQIPGLSLMPCGVIPSNPSELLNSSNLPALLLATAADYDEVVIDSSPVLPVHDARIIGAQCNVTLLVVRAMKSTRRQALHACGQLLDVGARMVGVVVNAVPRSRAMYGSYYYYGNDGYHREEEPLVPATQGLLMESAAKSNGNGFAGHENSQQQDPTNRSDV